MKPQHRQSPRETSHSKPPPRFSSRRIDEGGPKADMSTGATSTSLTNGRDARSSTHDESPATTGDERTPRWRTSRGGESHCRRSSTSPTSALRASAKSPPRSLLTVTNLRTKLSKRPANSPPFFSTSIRTLMPERFHATGSRLLAAPLGNDVSFFS